MGSKKDDKVRKGRIIERNWGCTVQEAIPPDIRLRAGTRSCAPIGSTNPEKPWIDWSYSLINELHKLSDLTVGKLTFAQELMMLEVRQRREDPRNRMRIVAEICLQDLRRITSDLVENHSTNLDEHDISDGDEEREDQGEDDVEDRKNGYERSSRANSADVERAVKIEDEAVNLNNGIVAEGSDTTIVKLEDVPSEARNKSTSHRILKNKAKILRLRADAMRLKQEAAKRLAEAFELEAKMLVAEDS